MKLQIGLTLLMAIFFSACQAQSSKKMTEKPQTESLDMNNIKRRYLLQDAFGAQSFIYKK
jgi:hypothetical protein